MPAPSETFDDVIIGAGAAGCVLAARLSEDARHRVCLVEAGPSNRHPFIHIPAAFVKIVGNPGYIWPFETEPGPGIDNRSISLIQGRVTGGGTSINGMVCVRGQPEDYDRWSRGGASGWSWQDVLPYFQKLECVASPESETRGTRGPFRIARGRFRNPLADAFIAAAGDMGMPSHRDYNGGQQSSAGYTQQAVANRFRVSAATAYLSPASRRTNLVVRNRLQVRRILFENGRATGVECVRPDGSSHVIHARREVILSAGAINTPRLLLHSGIGPAGKLAALGIEPLRDLQVGHNLRDHYLTGLKAQGNGFPSINRLSRAPALWGEMLRWAVNRPSVLIATPAMVSFFAQTDPGCTTSDVQGLFIPGSYRSRNGKREMDAFPGMTCTVWQHRPQSVGHVGLRSPEWNAPPIVQPNYLVAPEDGQAIVRGLKLARKLLESPQLAPFHVEELVPGPDVRTDADWLAFARANGSTVYHPVGTARMGGSNDPQAVVTPELKVRGVDGLRVVDASVMPELPSGNTALPTLMIAEKAADMILKSRRAEPAGHAA